ncbi:FixH family protein [Aureibacter tunicatorum]|uniref:Nitrogen fixation protein FixH n=1 Tax=Aureibacter tunicatorum TaxID=866807 RepID=A0AAE3XGR2_9BACT|nr:FixH family protein [Aureibacter tunicatorum]MDR6237321.1 hypothetical protein [Aureibacter tunicatorum]BDD06312.1 hypothetical protein AUTU_37950 [Aureibacter tunicatorum]
MNWGKAIFIVYTVFITMILSFVYVCVKQDISLVADDYYKQEIAYQSQIDKMTNAQVGEGKLIVDMNGRVAQLKAEGVFSGDIEGKMHLFRPADSRLDRTFDISLNDSGIQEVDLSALAPGLWKIKLDWQDEDGTFYYKEQAVVF